MLHFLLENLKKMWGGAWGSRYEDTLDSPSLHSAIPKTGGHLTPMQFSINSHSVTRYE